MDYRNPDDLRTLVHDANDAQIAAMFGVSNQTIRSWRHKFGIAPSPVPNSGNAKYSFDRSFFHTIDTPEKAYILGFIAADGAIHRNDKSLSIALMESDIDHLYAIRDALGGNQAIHVKNCPGGYQDGHRLVVLHLCGTELVHDLATHGVTANKLYRLCLPSVPSHLKSHLIRGLYDGDGHIGPKQFYLVGTPELIAGVQSAIQHHTGCLLYTRIVRGSPQLVGNRRDRAALTWMYDNAPLVLKRKFEKYTTFWT